MKRIDTLSENTPKSNVPSYAVLSLLYIAVKALNGSGDSEISSYVEKAVKRGKRESRRLRFDWYFQQLILSHLKSVGVVD